MFSAVTDRLCVLSYKDFMGYAAYADCDDYSGPKIGAIPTTIPIQIIVQFSPPIQALRSSQSDPARKPLKIVPIGPQNRATRATVTSRNPYRIA